MILNLDNRNLFLNKNVTIEKTKLRLVLKGEKSVHFIFHISNLFGYVYFGSQ